MASRKAPVIRAPMLLLELFVPGALRNPLNGSLSRAHWTVKSKWANEWKAKTVAAMMHAPATIPTTYHAPFTEIPKLIRFIANTGSTWDDDNLPAAIKPIRDALIGYVIHSDAPDSGHRFVYGQRVDRQRRGVQITVAQVLAAELGPADETPDVLAIAPDRPRLSITGSVPLLPRRRPHIPRNETEKADG